MKYNAFEERAKWPWSEKSKETKMAEALDSAFDFLHMEIVNYVHRERQGRFIEVKLNILLY